MALFKVVEKKNPLHVHALCETRERAEHWIKVLAPSYCARRFFTDKTLTPQDFEIKPAKEN